MKKPIGSTLLLSAMVLISVFNVACDPPIVPPPDSQSTLSGVVREQGTETPLPDITVALNSLQTTTDQNGRFTFQELPVGLRTLQVSTTGFDAYTKQIVVEAGDNSLDISLVRTTYYEFSSGDSDHFGIYLPPGVSTYRGVIFLGPPSSHDSRGFANGTPLVSPYPELIEFVAAERQRSLPLAEKYGLALMGAQVRSVNEQFRLLSALEHFAEESGHPELAQAPLLMMGFSLGACYAYEFTLNNSDRVIGFISHKSATSRCHSQQDAGLARLVPGYLFIGEEDTEELGNRDTITRLFEENRSQGALWALAIEPGAGRTPVRDQTLLFNWMDTVLEARLPETVSPGAPVALNALDETSGWLGHPQSFSIARYGCYKEERLQASWLPSMQAAQDWQAFVSSASVTAVTTCGNTP